MSLFHLLNGRNFGVYNRAVAHELGLHTTIFLSELLDKYQHYSSHGQTIEIAGEMGKWFYITADDMKERTTLGEKCQRNCLDKLTEMGFIRKKVSGLPAKRYFQVDEEKVSHFISQINFTISSKRPILPPPDAGSGSCQRPNSPIYKRTEEEPKEEDMLGADAPQAPTPKVPPRKRIKEEFIELAPRVFLTPSQQIALKTRLDASRITLDDVAVHLSDWKIGKGINGGQNDYSTILKWVIEAVCKAKQTTSDKMPDKPNAGSEAEKVQRQIDRAEQAAHDRMLITKIQRRFLDQFKIELIRSHGDFLEFNLGDRGGVIKCQAGSPGFREMCLKYLRSLNLDTSGL